MESSIEVKKRLCLTIASFASAILAFTLIFKLPVIANLFSPEYVSSTAGAGIWALVWIIIFLECGIIPGSYLPFLIFFASTPLAADAWYFIGFITSAIMCGRFVAYFIGQAYGHTLLRWALGHKYLETMNKMNGVSGKIFYAITVAAPGFPDFILAIVAGAVNINFAFYIIVNTVCKFIENILVVFFNKAADSGGNIWLYIYIAVIVICIILFLCFTIIEKYKNKRGITNAN